MTLQEACKLDAAGFQKACQDTESGMNNMDPINAGTALDEAVKSFGAFESTPQSILAVHNVGKSCP
ncbi:MAG: hypothetical protein FWF55_09700 [Treponema sp.]|jgi:hypothetical protein|nr:hypothetical protein [Treponema sp.]